MGWGKVLAVIFFIIVVALLVLYWFIPFNQISYTSTASANHNFILNDSNVTNTSMQFYPNMRYPTSNISYSISNCTLQKQAEMQQALGIIENDTVLNFYPVTSGEEVSISCDSHTQLEGGLFIAGEGGPAKIIQAGTFNVITQGKILLLRDSNCQMPLVPIHEMFHALGFIHSKNPSNVMYPVSKCGQQIGNDSIALIDSLYAYPSEPDLQFESANATMHGRYLDVNMSIRDDGLQPSDAATVTIYGDNNSLKTVDLEPLDIGEGRIIQLHNIFVLQRSINQVTLKIDYSGAELSKSNNEIVLKIS